MLLLTKVLTTAASGRQGRTRYSFNRKIVVGQEFYRLAHTTLGVLGRIKRAIDPAVSPDSGLCSAVAKKSRGAYRLSHARTSFLVLACRILRQGKNRGRIQIPIREL